MRASRPLTAHGFYTRTLVDIDFDGSIRIRRYLCDACKRTVSGLPQFTLPYIRFGITVISLFLIARLLISRTLAAAATTARLAAMPHQRLIHSLALSGECYGLRWLRVLVRSRPPCAVTERRLGPKS